MKVTLINKMGSIADIADMASICYGHEEARNPEQLFRNLIRLGHTSTLEHMVFTFKIEGISRACLAQLTRHRHASFIVRSQRYCEEKKAPYTMSRSIDTRVDVEKFMDSMSILYEQLLKDGVKREDARYILPNAIDTSLYMTINLRSLINFFQLRLDKSAQWEIRDLAGEMFNLLDKDLQEILKEEVL